MFTGKERCLSNRFFINAVWPEEGTHMTRGPGRIDRCMIGVT